MRVLGPVLAGLLVVAWLFRIRSWVEQIRREEPFGSKRWHWPAAALLGVLVIVGLLLRFAADSG